MNSNLELLYPASKSALSNYVSMPELRSTVCVHSTEGKHGEHGEHGEHSSVVGIVEHYSGRYAVCGNHARNYLENGFHVIFFDNSAPFQTRWSRELLESTAYETA